MYARVASICLSLAVGGGGFAAERNPPPSSKDGISSAAKAVYAAARPRLLQVRTLLGTTERQSSIGSAFFVTAAGDAITNYHVVSQYALEPETYRLEYTSPDGQRGPLKLIAFDIANDVALIHADRQGQSHFEFDKRTRGNALTNGERLYSMGNPLDIGFTIVEGTYNGRVQRSYNDRLHFSGALNPGMSGGPTVSSDNRVVGINVSKRFGGDLISFLVPSSVAIDLLAAKRDRLEPSGGTIRAEIARQLLNWQSGLYRVLGEKVLPSRTFGPYQAPDSPAAWFACWGNTNADRVPKPRALVYTTSCDTDTSLFIANDLSTGHIRVVHSHVKSVDLNAFQFANFVSGQYQPSWRGWNRKRHTRTRCHEAFLEGKPGLTPPVRAVWCARAYREFAGIYDVSLIALTQDRPTEALVTRLSMQGVSYENALQFGERFLGEIGLAR